MKKLILILLAALIGGALYQYFSAPVFWQRYVNTFRSSGTGADSPVFDVRETVRGASETRAFPISDPSVVPNDVRAELIKYAESFDSFALIVVHRGAIQLEWYRDDYDRDRLTQSQSMHKSLQALLVGIALDKGLIESIDDPVGEYLPLLANDDKGGTSIRNYLRMATGLKPFDGGFSPFGEAFRWLYADDIAAATAAIPLVATAGTSFDYHDASTQIIGLLLREVFDRRYAAILSDELWTRIGAGNAEVWLDSEGGNAHNNCCLLARAIDWAKVGQLILDSGRADDATVVSPDWLDQQLSPALTPHYGLQTWLASNATPNPRTGGGGYRRTEDWLSDDVVYFSGYGAQRVYISRDQDLVIVRLGPAAGYFPKIEEEWDNTFLFNTVVRALAVRE